MGLEPTTPCLQIVPVRTLGDTWGRVWPDQHLVETPRDGMGRLRMVDTWWISSGYASREWRADLCSSQPSQSSSATHPDSKDCYELYAACSRV
jgi:hypothetical protein